jgi:hypothetical protein
MLTGLETSNIVAADVVDSAKGSIYIQPLIQQSTAVTKEVSHVELMDAKV